MIFIPNFCLDNYASRFFINIVRKYFRTLTMTDNELKKVEPSALSLRELLLNARSIQLKLESSLPIHLSEDDFVSGPEGCF
jgi:hypothetical protein